MANIKSQKKSIRQDAKRTALNKSYKSKMKTAIKKAKASGAKKDINAAVKLIDGAVTKKILHKNRAAAIKSKVMKYLKEKKK
jgi:small subunit ribosomal protein S20